MVEVTAVELRTLGKNKLPVTPLGLGLAALGRPGYINLGHGADLAGATSVEAMKARSHAVLDVAWRAGIRYFDVARSYGRAEVFLREWLATRGIPPDSVTVGSKWGYTYTAGWNAKATTHEVKEHSLRVLRRQWRESQANLSPYLSLYQIHSATAQSGVLKNETVLRELACLKDEGVAIGLTLSGPGQAQQIRQALAVEVDGEPLFDVVQATWNLLDPSCGAALEEAHAAGLGVIVKEALANGRLTSQNTTAGSAGVRESLAVHAQRLRTSMDGLALAAVLAQPWADITLSGAVSTDQLASNLGALTVKWDGAASAELATLAEPAGTYWATRSALAWN